MKTQALRLVPALVVSISLTLPGCSDSSDNSAAPQTDPPPAPAAAEPVPPADAPPADPAQEAPPLEGDPAAPPETVTEQAAFGGPVTHEGGAAPPYDRGMPLEGEGMQPDGEDRQLTTIELYGYALSSWAQDFHRRAQELDEQMKTELPKPGSFQYHERLAALLSDRDAPRHADAVQALQEVNPASVRNKETRAKIARGFRDLATDPNAAANQESAIAGLVHWGGKFSAPVLLKMLEEPNTQSEAAILKGLGQVATPEAAAAVVARFESGANRDAASESLIQMGVVDETPLVEILPAETADMNLAAIKVLGEIGTKKCTSLLRRASQSENEEVAEAAREATQKVQAREREQARRDSPPAAAAASSTTR